MGEGIGESRLAVNGKLEGRRYGLSTPFFSARDVETVS